MKLKPVYATIFNNSQVCIHYPHTQDTNNHSLSGCGGLESFKKHLPKNTPVYDITNVPFQIWVNTPVECDKFSNVTFDELKSYLDFFECKLEVIK